MANYIDANSFDLTTAPAGAPEALMVDSSRQLTTQAVVAGNITTGTLAAASTNRTVSGGTNTLLFTGWETMSTIVNATYGVTAIGVITLDSEAGVLVKGNGGTPGRVNYRAATGTNGVQISGPDTAVTTPYTIKLPDTAPVGDKVLNVNASGVASWIPLMANDSFRGIWDDLATLNSAAQFGTGTFATTPGALGDYAILSGTTHHAAYDDALSTTNGYATFVEIGDVPVVDLSLGVISATTVEIDSSIGTNVTLPAATQTLAGVLTAADKVKIDNYANLTFGTLPLATSQRNANFNGFGLSLLNVSTYALDAESGDIVNNAGSVLEWAANRDITFPAYVGTAKDGTIIKSLGVDGAGKVVTQTPSAVASPVKTANGSILAGDITNEFIAVAGIPATVKTVTLFVIGTSWGKTALAAATAGNVTTAGRVGIAGTGLGGTPNPRLTVGDEWTVIWEEN